MDVSTLRFKSLSSGIHRAAAAVVLFALLLSSTFVYAIPEIKVRHILVRKKSTAEKALNEFLDRGAKRQDFINIARKYSLDHPTKGAGGDLGWNTPGKFVREFADEAFALEPGEFTFEPVRTEYGWHLIFVEQKRDTRDKKKVVRGAMAPEDPKEAAELQKALGDSSKTEVSVVKEDPPAASPAATKEAPAATPPAATKEAPAATPATTPSVSKVDPPKNTGPKTAPKVSLRLPPRKLKVTLEPVDMVTLSSKPMQVNVLLQNAGQEDLKVFNPELLALGLKVRSDHAPTNPPSDWSSLAEPESFVVTLKSRQTVGQHIAINDHFSDLVLNNRFWVSWDGETFLKNFRSRFADKVSTIEGFGDAEKAMKMRAQELTRVVSGVSQQHGRPYSRPEAPIPMSLFDRFDSKEDYFVRVKVLGGAGSLWFKLESKDQYQGADHFTKLAMNGFYDGLKIYDIRKGDWMLAGCPKNNGTGGPEKMLSRVQNSKNLKHEKGTLSLVTRGMATGAQREAGSIFFICLKAHPEWDSRHVPVAKLVDGEDVLDQLQERSNVMIESVAVVPADLAPSSVTGIEKAPAVTEVTKADASPAADGKPAETEDGPEILSSARANPKVELETSKGNLVIELYENDAANTVANFIALIENGTFPGKDSGKSLKVLDRTEGYFIRTGSPDNSDLGAVEYKIKSEVANNAQRHEKGTLSMCLEVDDQGQPVMNTASSQFFICLDTISFWDGRYTPFGKVTEGLDVLEKLTAEDSISATKVVAKRGHPYQPKKRDGTQVSQ